jgi:integrase
MARERERLSPRRVKTARPKGGRRSLLLCDGANLNLQITVGKEGNVRRSWIFRYQRGDVVRDMGLGSADDFSLKEARALAEKYRKLHKLGKDPISERDAEIARNVAAKGAMTFDEAAQQYISTHKSGWRNKQHHDQWSSSLKTYAAKIGRMLVGDVDTEHVMQCLNPIWHDKPETANRVRQRIELVLGWAGAQGLRKDEHGHDKPNPARWLGHLKNLLPPPAKVRKRKNQPALAYTEMPAFLADLRARTGIAPLALEFAILCGVRTLDVRNAKRSRIDHGKGMWVIPAYSKTGIEHRVPLSKPAMAVVEKVEAICHDMGGTVAKSDYLFPNDRTGKPLSENALLAVIERMGRKGTMTTHGCRASFRTWMQEQTNFPHELAEMSLGHKVGDDVVRAYMRCDALKKRIAVMESWANYLARPKGEGGVVPFARGA